MTTPTEARERDARHLLDLADKHEAQQAKVGQLAVMGCLTGRDLDLLLAIADGLRRKERNFAWSWCNGDAVYSAGGLVVTAGWDGDCTIVFDRARQDVTA